MIFNYYRPQQSYGQGYVFTPVCDSVNGGGLQAGRTPPGRETPRQGGTPPSREEPPSRGNPPGSRHPPQEQTPRQGGIPREQTPHQSRHPLGQTPSPWSRPPGAGTPQEQTHPSPGADCSIGSMSGRYASYWNAFLLFFSITGDDFLFRCPIIYANIHTTINCYVVNIIRIC